MRTIGAVYNKGLILFKNCDLAKKINFLKPTVKRAKYRYIVFTRKDMHGVWARINERGLGIVAADTYTKKKYRTEPYTRYNIFKGYEKLISDFRSVDEAEGFLEKYYFTKISVSNLY